MAKLPPKNEDLRERAHRLGLHGLLAHWNEIADEVWLPRLIEFEEAERQQRSLERRIKKARLTRFKPFGGGQHLIHFAAAERTTLRPATKVCYPPAVAAVARALESAPVAAPQPVRGY